MIETCGVMARSKVSTSQWCWNLTEQVGRNSSIGIATGWTVRGSNSGGRLDFPHPSRPVLGSTQPSVQWVPGLSLW
jgi:hypothetical protein